MNIKELKNKLNKLSEYGAYNKAIKNYAFEIVDNIENHKNNITQDTNLKEIINLKEIALNGAKDWEQYSWGCCSLYYNYDILEANFCPSIVKRYQNADTINGVHLLDIQANRLKKAYAVINGIIKRG